MNFIEELFKRSMNDPDDYALKPTPIPDNFDVLLKAFSGTLAALMKRRLQALEAGNKKLANNLSGQITGVKLAQTIVETFFYKD